MKFSYWTVIFATLSVMAWLAADQLAGAYVVPPTSGDPERTLARRSLCNTFGGCGAKRSMQQLVYTNGRQVVGSSEGGGTMDGNKDEPWSENRRESKFDLISEILSDLVDYLKTSEKYKQGKYMVMVSKPTDSVQGPTGGLQLNALDIQ